MKAAANASTEPPACIHVVMGVSASGKSTVGRLLAQARGATYLDGDDFHPPENKARMAAGTAAGARRPLTGSLRARRPSRPALPGPCRTARRLTRAARRPVE